MNPPKLAPRLRQARELAGLSQQQAASALGVPRTAVTQIEAGRRVVSTLELTRFAELYARPVMWFLSEGTEEEDLVAALHRAAPGIAEDPNIRREVDRSVALCREGTELERLLGRSSPVLPTYPMPIPLNKSEAIAQGEWVAEQERRRLDLGAAPIADIADLIAEQGVWAFAADLPDGVSGLFLSHADIGLAVLVNAAHVRGRKRFSYAHEYAHAVLDRDRSIIVSNGDGRDEMIETRANAFAAAFLMPAEGVAEGVKSLHKGGPSRIEKSVFDAATGAVIETRVRPLPRSQQITCQDVAHLAHRFGVSYLAALYRAKSLRFLSPSDCELLKGQEGAGREYLQLLDMKDLDQREPEPAQELRGRIARLTVEAYRREEISRGRLLELSSSVGLRSEALLAVAEAARDG